MELKWIQNQNLFPFINMELLDDILSFASGTKIITLKFSKAYNLEYIGELAERWHERNIVKDNQDLIALVLAVTNCSSGTFLYDQQKLFIKSICKYLKTNWNSIAAAAILRYGRNELETVPELAQIRDMFGQFTDNSECQSERVLLISLLSDFYAFQPANEEIRKNLLNLIDCLQLNITDSHMEYPLLLLLSKVFSDLKPTAKEFKTKGMSRLLQVIGSLRTKEISLDNSLPVSQALGVNRDEIPVYNYYLAYENTPDVHSITKPGFERIKENFISCHFSSEKDLPEHVIQIVDEMIRKYERLYNTKERHPLSFLLRRFTDKEKNPFPNRNNLKLLVEKAKKILLFHLNESYIYLLQEGVVEGKQREEIIEGLLTKHRLTKEQFDFLEQQRVFQISATPYYTVMCLEHGYISLDQIDELEKRGMLGYVIEHLKEREDYIELLDLLERVPDSYHQFLVNETTFDRLKSKMVDGLKRRLYPIYLSALYTYKASEYPVRVFDMLKNTEFITLFFLSNADIEEIERNLYNSKLLSESQRRTIREKYMSPEELHDLRLQDLCKELNGGSLYALSGFAGKHWSKMLESDTLRETFVEKLITLEPKDKYDVGRLLFIFYQLRGKNVFTPEQIERIDSSAILKTQKFNFA